MLEGLNSINWRQLTHAYGSAEEVPELIQNLTSSSRDIWEQAIEGLRSTICHQGTVYEATAYAVPFLIELLENHAVQCRDEILLELAYLACGGLMDDNPESHDWVNNAHNAVAQGLNVYLNLLEETDQKVRRYVPYVLFTLEELAPSIIPVLERHFSKETDPQAKANLILYLSSLPDYLGGDYRWLEDLVNADEEHLFVKTVAALCHIKHAKEQTPSETMRILLDVLAQPETVEKLYKEIPWAYAQTSGDLIGDISSDLLLLHIDAAHQVLPVLLQTLKNADHIAQSNKTSYRHFAGDAVLRTLFYFAFGGKALPKNAVPFLLTTIQRTALTAFLQCKALYFDMEKTANLLEESGLPYRWKLQRLLLLDDD